MTSVDQESLSPLFDPSVCQVSFSLLSRIRAASNQLDNSIVSIDALAETFKVLPLGRSLIFVSIVLGEPFPLWWNSLVWGSVHA